MQKPHQQIDELLVTQIISGDKIAFAKLVKRWHKQFCNKAYWLVKDKAVAKDIAQESWQIIMNKIEQLKEPQQFKSWALRIVTNKSLDHLRNKVKEREHFQDYKQDIVAETPYEENLKLKQELSKAIKELPLNQQVVIQLFYTESYSLRQISKRLNISVGTVKSRLFHAREHLKKQLKHIKKEY
ncbi:RNA polymerase sigma factor [Winogradskyella immobilis]|uniref:RNA polymerase sigma factor n=1 Tax=Winogradskyella immobilis TaxID=2816852 RepID=A0ABS8EKG2_9FLAO|nr:RNA polymerase sigma factor [Winogradskyella immobilis]MCC1483713.1 RNA polymerase sigma factor [Winogradskyella immobilis]MCG0015807.1 RNA polymerase sigma factor [Winogradskyella immobilis]